MSKPLYKRRLLGVLLFLALTLVFFGIFYPPYINLSKKLPEGNFSAGELVHEFTVDPSGAFLRLGDKVIILEGVVTAKSEGYLVMGSNLLKVRCVLRKTIYDKKPVVEAGEQITVKGICRGRNMTEILVDQCIMLKGGSPE